MQIIVQRGQGDAICTPGEMFLDGVHFCCTLEPRKDQSQGKPFCIPAYTYLIFLQQSQHFDMIVPVVMNVGGFTGVEIHPGNVPANTHGCTLVGFTESDDFVGQSRDAFDALMLRIRTGDTITYLDADKAQ
jgi:hypothetical protein